MRHHDHRERACVHALMPACGTECVTVTVVTLSGHACPQSDQDDNSGAVSGLSERCTCILIAQLSSGNIASL